MLTEDQIEQFRQLTSDAKCITIICHKTPDGDAIGSSLSLYNYFSRLNHEVHVISPDNYPEFLNWIPGNEAILRFDKDKQTVETLLNRTNLIICVDFNELSRINSLGELVGLTKCPKILIDHHPNPQAFADLTLSFTKAGATAAILCELLFALNGEDFINPAIATALYVGILTDTSCFNNPATTPTILRFAARLRELGVNHEDVNDNLYNNYSESRFRLLGHCLKENMKVIPDLKTAYIWLTKEELKFYNFKIGDTESIVNIPLGIKGIKISAIFTEFDNYIKISFRSSGNIDVNKLARAYFNGGGHVNASGGKSIIPLKETLELFEKVIPEFL